MPPVLRVVMTTVSFKHCAGCKPVNKKCHQTDNKANQPKFAERPEFGVEFIFQKALQKHNSGKDDDEQILQDAAIRIAADKNRKPDADSCHKPQNDLDYFRLFFR